MLVDRVSGLEFALDGIGSDLNPYKSKQTTCPIDCIVSFDF